MLKHFRKSEIVLLLLRPSFFEGGLERPTDHEEIGASVSIFGNRKLKIKLFVKLRLR